MSIKDLTIVITTFKSENRIEKCLNSIDKLCKVIIVENSANIEFKNSIEKKFNNVECILSGENLGYGKANNIGLKKTLTKYALILNPDTTLESSSLENFFKTVKEIPDFAIIGPYIQEEKYDNQVFKNTKPISVESVKGFAMFLNMEKFEDIGFFDERFFINTLL